MATADDITDFTIAFHMSKDTWIQSNAINSLLLLRRNAEGLLEQLDMEFTALKVSPSPILNKPIGATSEETSTLSVVVESMSAALTE